jgi:hypothetical protein
MLLAHISILDGSTDSPNEFQYDAVHKHQDCQAVDDQEQH